MLVALADHALNTSPALPSSSLQQHDAVAAFGAVWEAHSSLRGVPATLKRVRARAWQGGRSRERNESRRGGFKPSSH